LEPRQLLTVYGPLITFQSWNQDGSIGASSIQYNQYCPIDPLSGQRSVTGCGATALAQLLYYWQYPNTISFSQTDAYTSTSDVTSDIYIDSDASALHFPTFTELTKNLSNITYSGDPAEEAYLSFGLGVKLGSGYSSEETGSFIDPEDFQALGFSFAQRNTSWTTIKPTVIANIESGCPVLITIRNAENSGHFVILEGYNDVDDTFYTDFGWGGQADGWYSPPSFGTGYGFNSIDDVVYNICPPLTAPIALTASQGTSTGPVHLTWRPTMRISEYFGYEVWRSTSPDLPTAKLIARLPGTALSYDDDTPTDGATQKYYYWVRATSTVGSGDFSSEACGYRRSAPVSIPDASLLSAIRTALNKPWGNITNLDLLSLQTLDISGSGIQNLTGLEYATNLTSLDLHNNSIADVSPLANLYHLTTLHLQGNQISSISSLAAMTNLSVLSLDNNQISDLTPLAAMTKMSQLSLSSNQITNLSPLAGMSLLTNLSLDNNCINNLTPLANLTALTTLSFSQNQVVDVSKLSSLTNLTRLSASGNLIVDVTPLATLTRLTVLALNENRILEVSSLASLSQLTRLDVSNNYLDLTPGTASSTLIARLVSLKVPVASMPQHLRPQTVSMTLPTTALSFTQGKPSALSLALKCPTAPSNFSGTVTLDDSTHTTLASAAVASNGKVSWNLATLTPGTYSCTVNFPGDASHLAFQSQPLTLTVLPAGTSKTTLTSSLAAPVFGQGFTLTASVAKTSTGTSPLTGTVTFYDGTTLLATVALDANSRAQYTLASASSAGAHKYSAVYSGNSNFATSGSKPLTVKVQKDVVVAQPLSGAGSTVLVGQSFTLSASFSVRAPGAGIPTGLVTFKDGGKILAIVSLDSTGAAQCTVALASVGKHKITASYAGDLNNKPVVSAAVIQTVTRASTTTTLVASAPTASAGTPVTFTATVSRVIPAAGNPVGKIQFKDGTRVLATIALVNGTATFTTSKLLLGSHTLTATFIPTPTDLTSIDSTTLQIL
jgi:Leucine-rich repeat (LRR) protein